MAKVHVVYVKDYVNDEVIIAGIFKNLRDAKSVESELLQSVEEMPEHEDDDIGVLDIVLDKQVMKVIGD